MEAPRRGRGPVTRLAPGASHPRRTTGALTDDVSDGPELVVDLDVAPTDTPAYRDPHDPGQRARPVLDRVALVRSGPRVTAEVALRDGEVVHSAAVESRPTAAGDLRSVAQATIEATRGILDRRITIRVDRVDVVSVAGRHAVMVVVHLGAGDAEVSLSGSALVRDAAEEAAARAVLDALNRVLEQRTP